MEVFVTRCVRCGRFIDEEDMIGDTFGEMEMRNGVIAILTLCKFCEGGWIGDALWTKMHEQRGDE